ncbi:MAG: hypothetical protein H0T78_12230, partial [Longispora sp.]|nr:hypothetical protein [Longispora sp. (in: high G+C Gram-positive bacteria)]
PQGVDVIVEVDKRGGIFGGGHDTFFRFHAPHTEVNTDWAAQIDGWLCSTVLSRAPMGSGFRGAPQGAYGHSGQGGGHRGHRGSGIGGVMGGMAAGMLGGMVAGEVLDGAFEDMGDFGE